MRYKLAYSFLHLVRGSHDVFLGNSLFKNFKIYKQVDTSSAFLCQAVRIFPGHTGLCFSLVIPSFRWQQKGADRQWYLRQRLALGRQVLSFKENFAVLLARLDQWPCHRAMMTLSKGIHTAKIHKMPERADPWDCPLWMGRCAWLFSKGCKLDSNLKTQAWVDLLKKPDNLLISCQQYK